MQSVRTITLGTDTEQQIANMKTILRRGFQGDIAALCLECNSVQEFTVEETARMITLGTWPRCHDKRMEMIAPEEIPPF